MALGGQEVMSGRGGSWVVDDSATGVTSSESSCGVKASKRTHKVGDDAVPKISPSSSSFYSVRGIDCRPVEKKCSEGFE